MGLRSHVHNYFYGNPNQPDFSERDLPKNRWELFQDALSTNKGALVGLNLLYFACWLPAVAWGFLNLVHLYTCIQENTISQQVFSSTLFTFLLYLFPLIAITGPFNMGATYVLRNLARDQHSFVWSDFKDAMKRNWKQGLLLSTLDGLFPAAIYIWTLINRAMGMPSGVSVVVVGIVLAVALFWSLTIQLMPMMIVTYQQSFFELLANAALMTVLALPKAFAIKLLTLSVPILAALLIALIPSAITWALPAALALYAFFLLSLNKLITVSYANSVCEKYLNPKIAGAETNIGLHIKES